MASRHLVYADQFPSPQSLQVGAAANPDAHIFILGGAEDISGFLQLRDEFAQGGWTATALQLPGFGHSRSKLSTLTYESLITELKLRIVREAKQRELLLVGHSAGGLAAVILAADAELRTMFKFRTLLLAPAVYLTADGPTLLLCRLMALLSGGAFRPLRRLWLALRGPARWMCVAFLFCRFRGRSIPFRAMYQRHAAGRPAEPTGVNKGELLDEFVPLNTAPLYLRLVYEALWHAPELDSPLVVLDAANDVFVARTSECFLTRCRLPVQVVQGVGHFFPVYAREPVHAAAARLLQSD